MCFGDAFLQNIVPLHGFTSASTLAQSKMASVRYLNRVFFHNTRLHPLLGRQKDETEVDSLVLGQIFLLTKLTKLFWTSQLFTAGMFFKQKPLGGSNDLPDFPVQFGGHEEMSVDVDEVLKDTCWNYFVFEGRVQTSLDIYPLNHKNRQYTLWVSKKNDMHFKNPLQVVSSDGYPPIRHGENPREILRFWTSMLRLLLRLICNPSWRAWSMSLKPKAWTDDGETDTQRNGGLDWNLVIFQDIPGAWCLKHQLLSSLRHPEICLNFYFPRTEVKTLHQHCSDRNPFMARWNLLWFAHLQMKPLLEISNMEAGHTGVVLVKVGLTFLDRHQWRPAPLETPWERQNWIHEQDPAAGSLAPHWTLCAAGSGRSWR